MYVVGDARAGGAPRGEAVVCRRILVRDLQSDPIALAGQWFRVLGTVRCTRPAPAGTESVPDSAGSFADRA